ncbi:MAG: hypothetical protein H7Y89_10455 [Steroidobacteraceae bacterium]|nr:hypothetical protein [Steroidobacteraceae bacterium]
MGAWKKLTLAVLLGSALSGCMNLPADVRAELECGGPPADNHFGPEPCADPAR